MMLYTDAYLDGIDCALSQLDLEAFAGRSVLVTGASGLIGSALADMIFRANQNQGLGAELFLAGRSPERLKKRFSYWGGDSWRAVRYDALASAAFDFSADYVFHCASNAHPKMYAEQPVETIMANVVGTANILSYARDVGAERVLYVSSSEVYGSRNSVKPYTEGDYCPVDLLRPRSCYPNSKRTCETLCASYLAEYGVQSVVARPGHIYGPTALPSDSRAHAQFARDAAAAREIVMKSPGTQLRSYMHCTDCAAALLTIIVRGGPGEAYNVGDPSSICSIRELAEYFALAGGVAITDDYPTQEEAAGYNLMSCSALDCSKLVDLGFEAVIPLSEGVRQNIECWRDQV